MSRPKKAIPSYRLHSSGQAICTVRVGNGTRKDLLLGKHGTTASKAEYHRICCLLDSNGGIFPGGEADLTIVEAILSYVRHIEKTYGKENPEVFTAKRALKAVRQLYGPEPAANFGPKALKTIQGKWVSDGASRKAANRLLTAVKRCWRWLVSEELVPAGAYQSLQAVEGLRAGRTEAPETIRVEPADAVALAKILPVLPPAVAAVVKLQTLTGARCDELLKLKAADIDRSGEVWSYSPASHKGTWRGKGRTLTFGPAAQSLLTPLILEAGEGYLFSPARSEAKRIALRSANRMTPRWPSHLTRNATKRTTNRKRPPREHYDTAGIRHALERACRRVAVSPIITPHKIRHLAALTIRNEFGLEHTRAVLGHTVAAMTAHYSRDADLKLAGEVAAKIG